jgi:hypothetical protein
MTTHRFNLFADYFQFYLQDETVNGDLSESWTDEAVCRLLAIAPGTIGIGTVRNMEVPVELEIRDSPPEDDWDLWDQINECNIEIPSGRIVIAGCTDYFPDAARVQVLPGTYRARVYYGDLAFLSEDGLEGDDRYKIVLWPSPPGELLVLKQRKAESGG